MKELIDYVRLNTDPQLPARIVQSLRRDADEYGYTYLNSAADLIELLLDDLRARAFNVTTEDDGARMIQPNEWQQSGPDESPWGRITGPTVYINGAPHHLEGICVVEVDGVQDADPGAWPGDWEALQALYEGDGPYYTIELDGRQYVTYMGPFCQ